LAFFIYVSRLFAGTGLNRNHQLVLGLDRHIKTKNRRRFYRHTAEACEHQELFDQAKKMQNKADALEALEVTGKLMRNHL